MKTIFTLCAAFLTVMLMAQENRTDQRIGWGTDKYAADVIIDNSPNIKQGKVKLAVAFNGWLYAAFSTVDSSLNAGGINIMKSVDNGYTWTIIDDYQPAGIRYEAYDIVVAGTDTNNLTLYLIGINHALSTDNYTLFVDKYNATTGNFIVSPFNRFYSTTPIKDVSMATDYLYPAVNANPYSIAFVYSVRGAVADSLKYVVSLDGGSTFTTNQTIQTTGYFLDNVSLAYGRSASGSNGRYFAAWELNNGSSSRVGHIYTSRSSSTVDGSWITPENLDSISPAAINLCSNPSIAVAFGTIDNDSASNTAVVAVQRDYMTDGSDYDLIGFYNNRSHYTNFWYRFDIDNSGSNCMQPDVTFDPINRNFLAVYYDSTTQKLPYVVNEANLDDPSTWGVVSAQYNDGANLVSPFPRVEINPVVTQTAHAWTAVGTGTNGVAMFDAEYSTVGIEASNNQAATSIFPNPASSSFNIEFSLPSSSNAIITIVDMSGRVIEQRIASIGRGGLYTESFNVMDWDNGVYLITVQSDESSFQERIVVTH